MVRVFVIVRFTNRKGRDQVFGARLRLKSVERNRRVYINEDLQRETARLSLKARKLCKSKTIYGAWTTGGTLYIRRSSDPTCKPEKVLEESDLPG